MGSALAAACGRDGGVEKAGNKIAGGTTAAVRNGARRIIAHLPPSTESAAAFRELPDVLAGDLEATHEAAHLFLGGGGGHGVDVAALRRTSSNCVVIFSFSPAVAERIFPGRAAAALGSRASS